jgi:hypothetical protein
VADRSTFRYLDSVGTVHSNTFDTLFIRGGEMPWKWRYVPNNIFEKADGSKETKFRAFQRIFSIELRALNAYEDFIRAFLQASTKSITYQGLNILSEESFIVFESAEYENEWHNDFKLTKRYVIEFVESRVRTVWPPYSPPPTTDDLMYIAKKIKIIGTQASPETFTTNAGQLLFNYGTTVYPSISLLSYVVTVIANGAPYQDAKINQVGDITQSGSDITFKLAVSDSGNPSSDTFFYADITIGLQAII